MLSFEFGKLKPQNLNLKTLLVSIKLDVGNIPPVVRIVAFDNPDTAFGVFGLRFGCDQAKCPHALMLNRMAAGEFKKVVGELSTAVFNKAILAGRTPESAGLAQQHKFVEALNDAHPQLIGVALAPDCFPGVVELLHPAPAVLVTPGNGLVLTAKRGNGLLNAEWYAFIDQVLAVAECTTTADKISDQFKAPDLEARRPATKLDALLGQGVAQRKAEGVAKRPLGLRQLLFQLSQHVRKGVVLDAAGL